jgi:preprotein translocase subunit YajC
MVILICGLITAQVAHCETWVTVFLAVLLALDAGVFLFAFLYLMLKRPHSLRSESFDYRMSELIQKRAVEIRAGMYEEVKSAKELGVREVSHTEQSEGQAGHE